MIISKIVANMHYRVEMSMRWPQTYYSETGCESSECLKGIQTEIFHLMRDDFNFSYTLIANNDPVGIKRSNGSWDGMIGQSHKTIQSSYFVILIDMNIISFQ